jgi:WD40 repeat protein
MSRLLKTLSGGHTEPVVCIALSDDGSRLLSGSRRGADGVKLWRVDSAQILKSFPVDDQDAVEAVAFSANGGEFAAAATHRNTLMLWNIQNDQLLGSIESPFDAGGLGVAFLGGGPILAIEGRLYRRFSANLQLLQTHDNLQLGRIFSPAVSADGRFVVSIHAEEPIELVVYDLLSDAPSLRLPPAVPDRGLRAVAFTPDGTGLFAGGVRRKPMTLSVETGDIVRSFANPGHAKSITSVAVAPNGRLAVTGSEDFTAKVWNMSTGAELASLDHGGGFVNCVAISRDSLRAFTGGYDENVMMWDLSGLV